MDWNPLELSDSTGTLLPQIQRGVGGRYNRRGHKGQAIVVLWHIKEKGYFISGLGKFEVLT